MKKRVFSMILAVCLFIPMFVTAASAASNDYTTWKQFDSSWNQQEAWPSNKYPNATMRYMRQAGCVVTSVAMLLRQYNIVTDSNVNNFNPWVCNEALKAAGAFDSAANLYWGSIRNAYPGFVYAGKTTYSAASLYNLYRSGYACIVSVNNGGTKHFVAVQSATSTSASIMDPGSSYYTSLSNYGTKYDIYYFSVTASASSSTSKNLPTISGYNTPSSLKVGQAYSIKGTINSDSPITSVTVGVYNTGGSMVTGKTVAPNSTSYSLTKVDNDVYFNKLAAGGYHYRITTTNSAGTTTLVDTVFTVRNSNSIYCSLKPACATNTRLDISGGSTESQANAQIYTSNNTLAQWFELRPVGNGYYIIVSLVSGKVLDVSGGAAQSGTNIWQYDYNGTDAQLFGFIDAGGGYYYIVSKLDHNLCIDVSSGGSTSGLNVQIYSRNNTNAQKWMLMSI